MAFRNTCLILIHAGVMERNVLLVTASSRENRNMGIMTITEKILMKESNYEYSSEAKGVSLG